MISSDFNPLTAQLASLEEAGVTLALLNTQAAEDLRWYDSIDPEEATVHLRESETAAAELEIHALTLTRSVELLQTEIERLRPLAAFGWVPFLSKTRSRAAYDRDHALVELRKLAVQLRATNIKLANRRQRLEEAKSTSDRYATFDRKLVSERLVDLATKLKAHQVEFEKLRTRARAVDAELETPLAEFNAIQTRVARLKGDRTAVERYLHDLNLASDGRERAKIHSECERRFGTGRPSEVLKTIDKELAPKNRTLVKLERRLREIGRRGSIDVRALVIDGSNLCYEDGKLIGLFAIRALCADLTPGLSVAIVFDASITGEDSAFLRIRSSARSYRASESTLCPRDPGQTRPSSIWPEVPASTFSVTIDSQAFPTRQQCGRTG